VVESPIAFLLTLRGGRIVHGKGFLDWASALKAGGLTEECFAWKGGESAR
jgi:hypothetical protein